MKILHEDNHLLVAVKPAGLLSQSDDSGTEDVLSMLKAYIKVEYSKPGDVFLGLVHRLDRNAGGVMVFARTSKAAARLSEQIRERAFNKEYLAVVEGGVKVKEGELVDWILKDEQTNTSQIVRAGTNGAKEAKLKYSVLAISPQTSAQSSTYSLVHVELLTGRSHQIRAQFANAGYPLWGDSKYGAKSIRQNSSDPSQDRLGLWAHSLGFQHPTLKTELKFVELPDTWVEPWSYFAADLAKIASANSNQMNIRPQKFNSSDEHTTRNIAAQFLRLHLEQLKESCLIFFLEGELGAGKTQFVKGIAHALGIEKTIVSPTYMYMRNYVYEKDQLKGELVHIDAWRVEQQSDFDLLRLQEYIKPGNVLCVEWPKELKIPDSEKALEFKVEITGEEAQREITIARL